MLRPEVRTPITLGQGMLPTDVANWIDHTVTDTASGLLFDLLADPPRRLHRHANVHPPIPTTVLARQRPATDSDECTFTPASAYQLRWLHRHASVHPPTPTIAPTRQRAPTDSDDCTDTPASAHTVPRQCVCTNWCGSKGVGVCPLPPDGFTGRGCAECF